MNGQRNRSNTRNLLLGIGAVTCLPVFGVIFLTLLFVTVIIGATGNVLGWLFGGGAPDISTGDLTRIAAASPETTIRLWTPTPIPDSCYITPTPVPVTVMLPPDTLGPQPTPVDPGNYTPPPTNTAGYYMTYLPTPTPCPTARNSWPTPDPRWTPLPPGFGPHGSPYRSPYVITQNYGCTDFPEFENQVCALATGGRRPWFHRGTDLVSLGDKTVYSTLDGRVTFAGWLNDGFGNRVYVSQPPYLVIFPHLSRVLVAGGKTVHWGEPLGVEGSTGYSTGSHLHYEIHIDNAWADSLPYLTRS